MMRAGMPAPMTKRKSKGTYMISAVAEMHEIHPQTLRLYEREGLLKTGARAIHNILRNWCIVFS
jgi:MerR-like DNA binding protein